MVDGLSQTNSSLLSNTTGNQSQNSTLSSSNINNQTQTPVFNAQQLQMQGQAGNLLQQILSGNVQSFAQPNTQAAYDAAFANFNKYQAPQLAAQYGAGSPAINSSMQELNQQLAGQAVQWNMQAMPNALNAFNSAARYAFQPLGTNQSTTGTNTGTQSTTQKSSQTTSDVGSLLAGLASLF